MLITVKFRYGIARNNAVWVMTWWSVNWEKKKSNKSLTITISGVIWSGVETNCHKVKFWSQKPGTHCFPNMPIGWQITQIQKYFMEKQHLLTRLIDVICNKWFYVLSTYPPVCVCVCVCIYIYIYIYPWFLRNKNHWAKLFTVTFVTRRRNMFKRKALSAGSYQW